MRRIQFGWILPNRPGTAVPYEAFSASLNKGLELVAGHFDSAWFTDHLQDDAKALLEGWTSLTYMAALYPQFHFGHAVLCQSFRNPALLAKMAATLQYISGGRFILGLGAGWKEDEYKSYGYDFPSAGTRIGELEETLQIVRALWQNKQATVLGKHYQVVEAFCEPKPDPLPPLMIGGSKPRLLRIVARYADWWNVSSIGIDNYRLQVEECERACEEVSRDPKTLRRTWFGSCLCAPTEAEVKAINANQASPTNGLVGTPAQIIEQMRPFMDLGVDYFMLRCWGFPNLTTLETLVHEVLPALNS